MQCTPLKPTGLKPIGYVCVQHETRPLCSEAYNPTGLTPTGLNATT